MKASYFVHVFRLWEKKFRPEGFPKLFFLRVQRKKRATYVFWEKIQFLSKNNSIQLFNGKFFKGLLKLHCTCQVDKIEENRFFFVWKLNISILVNWAKVFGNLAKIFQQCCQNYLKRVHSEPMKKKISEKSYRVFFFVCILINNFWHPGVFLGHCSQEKVISRCPEVWFKKNGNLTFFSRCRTFS